MGRLRRGEILLLVLGVSVSLQAQESRVDIQLFGLASYSSQKIATYTSFLNVFGDGWLSHQDVVFEKSSLRPGWGAGLTYWVSHDYGLQIEARRWTRLQPSQDHSIHIEYSYFPWYPYPSDEPVEISNDLKSDVPPELSYSISAFSLNVLQRGKIGPVFLEASGGLTIYQVGGGLKDLYLHRTIPSSHGTFQSDSVLFATRFDFWSLGGNVGAGLAVPLGGNWEGLLAFKYFFGEAREPEMFVESMAGLDGPVMTVVIPGIDDIKEHVGYGPLKISPSSFSLNIGLRYRPSAALSSGEKRGKFRLMFETGASRLNPDFSFERALDVKVDGSRQVIQGVELFNRKTLYSFGLGLGRALSPHWMLELSFRHGQRAAAVDAWPVYLIEYEAWAYIVRYQRPQAEIKLDEWTLSLVRSFSLPGAELLASVGGNVSRLSLPMKDLYFRYLHKPGTDDFVSYSGLYSTAGTGWTYGARFGLGLHFAISGPLEGRLEGSYNLYRKAQIGMTPEEIELDEETWGDGDFDQLTPDMLKVSPAKLPINPSGFRLAFALAISF